MESIVKSPNDRREYRVIKLKNGLTATLISDPKPDDVEEEEDDDISVEESDDEGMSEESGSEGDSDMEDEEDDEQDDERPGKKKCHNRHQSEKMAAAALCVGIGSFSDPDDIPGLAHFLEHMVFMGSEKYPDESDFDGFLKKHGGSSNAYTDCERTVFHFDVHKKYFEEALDIFANFFVKPLFNKGSVDREIEAVDSEYDLSRPSDYNRKQQIMASFTKPGHPMGKFMWGNTQTLRTDPQQQGIDVYSRLREFWSNMYSSQYMTLAIQSRESLDTLELWVRHAFSAVPNNGHPQPDFTDIKDTFDTSDFYKLYKIVPVKKCHLVDLTWALPSLLTKYRAKPLHYLGWLIGHEGKGSILSYLKKKCWALSLSSGNGETGYEHNSTWAVFTVSLKLTEDGYNNLYEVLTAVFQYIAMLRQEGTQERIYREIQKIEDNNFRWQEQVEPVDYVEHVCENMQLYPVMDYLTGDILMYDYDDKIIDECTRYLVPEKVNIMLMSQKHEYLLENIETEKWYQTKYQVRDIDEHWITSWQNTEPNPEFHFPVENTYIATDFSLKEGQPSDKVPVLISETPLGKLWYRKDDKFKVPKAYIHFHFMSPVSYKTAESSVLLDLFVGLLKQNLSEVAYAADVAQLEYTFKIYDSGFVFNIQGFNHKISLLFQEIVDHLTNFDCSCEMFEALKNQCKHAYHNQFIKPGKLVKDVRLRILQQRYWGAVDKYQTITDISRDRLMEFVSEFLGQLFVEGLIGGNISSSEALDMEKYLHNKLCTTELPESLHARMRVSKLPQKAHYVQVQGLLKGDENCAITNYHQAGPVESLHDVVINELLVMMMEEPCFLSLRTRDQLGYAVWCTNHNTSNILGISVSIESQSTKFSMAYLDKRINHFLQEFYEKLKAMPQDEFETNKNGLINLKKCEDANLFAEGERHWNEIQVQRYIFSTFEIEIAELEKLTLEETISYYQQHVIGKNSRKLSCQILADSVTEDQMNVDSATPLGSMEKNGKKRNGDVITETPIKRVCTDDDSQSYRLTYLPYKSTENTDSILDGDKFKDSLDLYPVIWLNTDGTRMKESL